MYVGLSTTHRQERMERNSGTVIAISKRRVQGVDSEMSFYCILMKFAGHFI
jgi:hypothetical protein